MARTRSATKILDRMIGDNQRLRRMMEQETINARIAEKSQKTKEDACHLKDDDAL